jgi:SAM-dependent methyltransferase
VRRANALSRLRAAALTPNAWHARPVTARHAPAADRNAEPIREVLARVLPPGGLVLELASGTGQHAVHMARALPDRRWQPSDLDPGALASIAARAAEAGLPNLLPAIRLDAAAPAWPLAAADAVVAINMIHIAPWSAALGLVAGAARLLAVGAPLVTYGPYRFAGRFTAPSNEAFDASLRARDPAWGVRDVADLAAAAAAVGLRHAETIAMPANNHVLVFRREVP